VIMIGTGGSSGVPTETMYFGPSVEMPLATVQVTTWWFCLEFGGGSVVEEDMESSNVLMLNKH
jgi:hypothetical protein